MNIIDWNGPSGQWRAKKFSFGLALLFLSNQTFAASGNTNMMTWGIVAILAILALAAVSLLVNNLLLGSLSGASKAKSASASLSSKNLNGIDPEDQFHKIRKGHDIILKGVSKNDVVASKGRRYAIQPSNFKDIFPIPKMVRNVGDNVLAGEILFFDKERGIKFASPVSGEIIELNRGPKRRIDEVVILADENQTYKELDPPSLNAGREELISFLVESGFWPQIRQRPFNVIPDPEIKPVNIFVSTFDTAPLAINNNLVISGNEDAFQKGIDVLAKLTDGKVYVGLNGNDTAGVNDALKHVKNAERHWFKGPHPVGNVGIQIHHTAPLNNGELQWTLGVQEVISLGKLFTDKVYNVDRIVNVAGDVFDNPTHISTKLGASIAELAEIGGLKSAGNRLISGDVLSGEQKSDSQYLNFFDETLTGIKEGHYYELFGWLFPHKLRPSVSASLPGNFLKNTPTSADTNSHGEDRAFVVTGQYEKVLPVDTYPQHLFKAIMANDFERMEGLGILELVEEDVALCEFACTSKQPLQKILRKGLDAMAADI